MITEAIRILGAKRILFGSDEPYNVIRGTFVTINKQHMVFRSHIKYDWMKHVGKEHYQLCKQCMPSFHLQELEATREAITVFPNSESIKADIFFRNACRILHMDGG